MRFTIIALAIICLSAIGAFCSVLYAHPGVASRQDPSADQPSRSVWDGVYTEDQAKRGKKLYEHECMKCHGASLTGGDGAAPLSGDGFLGNWSDQTLDDLLERMRVTMPQDDPGKLNRQEYADVITYVLSFNKFPAGKEELSSQSMILKQIRIEANKPEKKQTSDQDKSKSETK